MDKILIFAGTSEGRLLAEHVSKLDLEVHVCVATEYGTQVLDQSAALVVHQGRMDRQEIEELLKSRDWKAVVDATHPYALEITSHLKDACVKTNQPYLRLLRDTEGEVDQTASFYVNSKEEAAAYLNGVDGNILLTTGSKELFDYLELIEEPNRLFVRILPDADMVAKCQQMGLLGKQIICMQGPFTAELNTAMIRQLEVKYLVTKDTGSAGGFPEKLLGAKEAGAQTVIVRRPMEESGFLLDELLSHLGLPLLTRTVPRTVTLMGMGMGTQKEMTLEAMEACRQAQVIVGAKRMLETLKAFGKPLVSMYRTEDILSYLEEHQEYSHVLVALSGDVGFYSGCRGLVEALKIQPERFHLRLICGVSSMEYLCSRLKLPWEDVVPTSLHGRRQNVIGAVRANPKVFVLVGGYDSVQKLSEDLISFELAEVKLHVGNQLSYPEETLQSGTPADFLQYDKEGLSVVLIENESARAYVMTHGLPDEAFIRGRAPMTKEEIRSISLSKLRLTKDAVVYDIGAGTGAVAIECARMASQGIVYAIEKKEEAIKLLWENRHKLGGTNLKIIGGTAPDALCGLPAATHAFIGGSSGCLGEIIEILFQKNPDVRIVINAIAMETVAEIIGIIQERNFNQVDMTQVFVGKATAMGSYHMMMGQNPIYIVTLQGVMT